MVFDSPYETRDLEMDRARAALDMRLFGDAPSSSILVAGRYRLDSVLGVGASGWVYRAHDETLDREVALKLLQPVRGANADALAEARTLAKVRHPAVVTVHDASDWHDGQARHSFVVMEPVQGSTLDVWLSKRRSWRQRLGVLTGIANGLQAAHEQGVVHGDIAPANVIIDRGGTPTLIDFGASTHRAGGTPGFVAPEVIAGEAATAASDQYSFFALARYIARNTTALAWLRSDIARGTQQAAEQRWPSLGAWRSRVRCRRVARRGMLGAALVCLIVGVFVHTADAPGPTCDGLHANVESRIAQRRDPMPDATTRWVAKRLGTYAESWAASCRATSEPAVVACLGTRKSEFDAAVALLDSAPSARVVELVGGLSGPDQCRQSPSAVPRSSPAIARADALTRSGRYDEARAVASTAMVAAAASGEAKLGIAAARSVAAVDIAQGEYAAAEYTLLGALQRSHHVGDEIAIAEIADALARVDRRQHGVRAQGEHWLRVSNAAIEQLGSPPSLVLGHQRSLADRAYVAGNFAGALALHRGVLQSGQQGTDLEQLATRVDIGRSLFMLGRNEEALESFELVLTESVDRYGPWHPAVARALERCAAALASMGHTDEAEATYLEALEILRTIAPDDVSISKMELGLAWTLQSTEPERAGLIVRQLIARETQRGGSETLLARARTQLGHVLRATLRPREAVASYERSLEFWSLQEPDHPSAALARLGLGLAWLDLGNDRGAIEPLTRGLHALQSGPVDPAAVAGAQFALARALWRTGRGHGRARALASAALVGLQSTPNVRDQWRVVDDWLRPLGGPVSHVM